MTYDRTQVGWLVINLMVLVILVMSAAYLSQWGTRPLPLYGFIILATVFCFFLLMFFKMRIRINDQGIHIIYGIGLVHIRIKPERIQRAEIVRVPWYYGLGIRVTPRGMLYSIQGLDAVEIEYLKGSRKRVLLGSDDCRNLKNFIDNKYRVPESEGRSL